MATRKKISKSFLTTREAAQVLGVSLRTVQLWAESGLLRCWKTDGGHRRIPRASVERLLDSRESQESVFLAESGADKPPAKAAEPDERLHILVVEDEPTLLRLYRMQLARWDLQPDVRTAKNGFEALLHIGRRQPDLLVADLYMPEMDGFQMLRTLRDLPDLDHMEIVVVTGLSTEDVAQGGGLPEGIPVLPKPIPFSELERMARHVAAQRGRFAGSPPGGNLDVLRRTIPQEEH